MRVERVASELWETASLLLVGDDASVAVDPGVWVEEVAALERRARELDAPIRHALVTHADWDHVCGLAPLREAVVAAGAGTSARIASGEPGATAGRRAREHGREASLPPRVDRVLEVGRAHRIGPFVVETIPLPGHTPDGTAFRVRALDVLAVGDHLSSAEFPFVSDTARYRATLAGLVELLRHDPPGLVVPGHGPALTGEEALANAEADLAYLRELQQTVTSALGEGAARDEARTAGLAVALPRPAPDDLDEMRAANVDVQLEELLPQS